MEKYFSSIIKRSPAAFTMFISAVAFKVGPSFGITIIGDKNRKDASLLLNSLQELYLPNCVIVFKSEENDLNELIDNLENKTMVNQQVTAYICGDGTCYPPVNSLKELLDILN